MLHLMYVGRMGSIKINEFINSITCVYIVKFIYCNYDSHCNQG